MEKMMIALFGSAAVNIVLAFFLAVLFTTTHAVEEFKAKLGKKAIILINTGDRWVFRVATVEPSGLLKAKDGYFVKTPHSLLFDDKKIPFAIAKPESAYLINSDLAMFGNKIVDEGEEKVGEEIAEKGGVEKVEELKWKGVTINFDNVRKFFKALGPASVNAKVQYEVANALEKERNFLNFNNVMLVVILLLGAAIAYVIIKGGGASQIAAAAKSVVPHAAHTVANASAAHHLSNVTVISG